MLPAFTVAVRVTTVVAGTSVTATPPEVTVSVVVVADWAAQAYSTPPQNITNMAANKIATGFKQVAGNIPLADGMGASLSEAWRGDPGATIFYTSD
jgi:hypothetical protein